MQNRMEKRLLINYVIGIISAVMLLSCAEKKPKFIIGVSQCSEDIWRNWQNSEMKMEANFHDNVELRFAAALDDSKRQIQQIDSLVESGIQLLIVAPNQLSSVSPAIDRAYDKGIPVIVFERKTDSQKYTAFVSADNYEMGRLMGEYIVSLLGGKGKVMEVLGLKGSSPADDRHKGFHDAITAFPQIEVVAELQGDWTEESGYEAVKTWLDQHPSSQIDCVFGHNDRMAIGARAAVARSSSAGLLPTGRKSSKQSTLNSTLYCGIDGLPGKDGGIQQVRDSLLDASYVYPTRGDQLLQLALDILEGKPYPKETMLTSALVTPENAKVLLMETDEIVRQTEKLDLLHEKADGYLKQLDTQRTITYLAIGVIGLLLVTLVLFYLYYLGKELIRHERVVNNLWNMDVTPTPPVVEEHPEEPKTPAEETAQKEEEKTKDKEPLFIIQFKKVVEANLANSDISVDDLAANMNLSRVQLYRKVKAITGSTPVELLRTARLNRGYQLLLKSDKTVSEVAYEVGFSAPSYFTKCFKDEFGISPSDL